MKNRAYIKSVEENSIAENIGIESGDILLSIDGKKIKDIFDYRYLCCSDLITVNIQKKNNEIWDIEIEKDENEDLGVIFENDLIDEEKSCRNKCIFCFIDQLPPSMRKTLYFKDDDARLSFLTGNYVTLTNMSTKDLERIAKLRLSPVNISVHTTNPELRIKMLGNRHAGDILEKIRFLSNQKITMNCQIVLCRGINDNEELINTLNNLYEFYPYVNSVSAVPVGITKYRKSLYPLIPYDYESSLAVIEQVFKLQKKYKKEIDKNFIYLADEFYLMAEKDIPDSLEYDGFPQIENGVGLIASFRDEIDEILKLNIRSDKKRNISIATGMLAYDFIKETSNKIMNKFKDIKIQVFCVENKFFGETVNVAGLLTGNDIIDALKGKELGDCLLLTSCMLKSDEDKFLDDVTLNEMKNALNMDIIPVRNSGKDFIDKVTGGLKAWPSL